MAVTTRNNSDKRVIRTKKAIRTALFKIMESKDITSITISELTALANVNRRTFYTHYSNITDILDETESEIVDSLTAIISRFDSASLVDSTYTIFLELSKLITEQYGFYFHLMKSDFRGVLVSRMKTVLKASADKILGNFTITSEEKYVILMASFINGGFLNLFLEWNKSGKNVSIDTAARVASVMVDFCVKNVPEITDTINNTEFTKR